MVPISWMVRQEVGRTKNFEINLSNIPDYQGTSYPVESFYLCIVVLALLLSDGR
jgi:hypothetical protein